MRRSIEAEIDEAVASRIVRMERGAVAFVHPLVAAALVGLTSAELTELARDRTPVEARDDQVRRALAAVDRRYLAGDAARCRTLLDRLVERLGPGVAIRCADAGSVEAWCDHLDGIGVAHSGIQASPFGTHLNFKDPDGIALEVFAAAQG